MHARPHRRQGSQLADPINCTQHNWVPNPIIRRHPFTQPIDFEKNPIIQLIVSQQTGGPNFQSSLKKCFIFESFGQTHYILL